MRFRNRAAAWWIQLKTTRACLGKPKIMSWDKLKSKLKKTFLPYNYDQLMFQRLHHIRQGSRSVAEYSQEFFLLLTRVDIQDSELQLALTIESQTKSNYSWSASRTTRPTQHQQSTNLTDDSLPQQAETALVPVTDKKVTRTSSLRCFACGEIGHRQANCPKRNRRGLLLDAAGNDVEVIYDEEITETLEETEDLVADTGPCLMMRRVCLAPRHIDDNPQRHNLLHSKCTIAGKVCKFIIDSESSENVVAEDVVNKLNLTTEIHLYPYKLAWLDKKTDLTITRRTLISYSVGGTFQDQIYCDIAPMDACHLLLGRPWLFDHRVKHDSYRNTYSFRFNDKNFTLQPSLPEKQ
uniref:CCHC-type domain-containing protein n=1 Tax=Brassica oleracea var. oleracea TaxID=109376 RepID=A0A0D3E466_BRAOL